MYRDSMLYPRNTKSRRSISLDGMWKFCFDPEKKGGTENWKEHVPTDEQIPVPSSFQDLFIEKSLRDYAGDVWYETPFFVPGEWKGKEIALRFGAAAHLATVYVNGQEVRTHKGGFTPFEAVATDEVRYDEENVLVVKLNNELSCTTLPCGETKELPDGSKIVKPYFDFFPYSGLQRSVWLVAYPKERIFDYDLTFEIDGKNADVFYDILIQNRENADAEVTLYDAKGNQVASGIGCRGKMTVKDAHLWEVRNAYLYKLVITLKDGEQIVDEYSEEIGIRTVEVVGEEIRINGKSVYLKGFGKHEDFPVVGKGYCGPVVKRDFELMKWTGANSYRTSHYPYSEETYQMADREGFLVIDEVAAVGMFESLMNFMEASTGKKTAFFRKDTTEELLEHHLECIEALIRRDKNHACVFAWSLLNEPESTSEGAREYFEKVFAKAHEADHQKRPRTFALIMNSLPHNCQCYDLCDFISLNRYYGWYVMGGSEISLAEAAFRKEMDAWKAQKLNKPFVFTEYGADTLESIRKLPSVMWSEDYQTEYLEMSARVFDDYPMIKGEQVWNFADFQTTEGIMRVNGNHKGIFTRDRQPKNAAYELKKRWECLPLEYKS